MAVRNDQDLVLAVERPSSALARWDQDLVLAVERPSSALARWDQDVVLVVIGSYQQQPRIFISS
jgi:hypothetical protein